MTGDVGQSVRQDYGEFIQIKSFRIRRDLILMYGEHISPDYTKFAVWVHYHEGHHGFAIACDSKEEMQGLVQRLDWIFKKEEKICE